MKIALCIPCYGDTKAKFTQCLVAMVAHTLEAKVELDGKEAQIEFETFIVSSSLLLESRNRLVAEAINWEADYMLWMDADHVFPREALLMLLSRSRLVVGCNYARRFSPTSPTASKLGTDNEMDLVWTTREKAEAGELEEVAHVGLGLCLVDMRVYAILERWATEQGKEHFWPLFEMPVKPNGIGCVGEDVSYFKTLREAGVKIFLDHELSWDVGHISEQILTNAHTIVQKPKYEEWTKRKMDKFRKEEVECQ
ncbi:MAG TPA: hypothetical protein VLA99_05950 [Nitrospiraceae bacterium]|nr:hypothetical protein [Nitrospiraceae bacterium]